MLLPQLMKVGACYWQVGARCRLKQRWRGRWEGGWEGRGSAPRSPQPSHAHACLPAVNSTPLTTGSHLGQSLGKTSPEAPNPARAFWGGEGGEDSRTLGCKWPAHPGTRGKKEG